MLRLFEFLCCFNRGRKVRVTDELDSLEVWGRSWNLRL